LHKPFNNSLRSAIFRKSGSVLRLRNLPLLPIAEYVIMTMLVMSHRLFEAVTAFRGGSWLASPQFGGGPPHGEVLGRTIGIIGYGRIGREWRSAPPGLNAGSLPPTAVRSQIRPPPKPFFP
jgi:phosphoglycerate dehydrogenase-like enzyme